MSFSDRNLSDALINHMKCPRGYLWSTTEGACVPTSPEAKAVRKIIWRVRNFMSGFYCPEGVPMIAVRAAVKRHAPKGVTVRVSEKLYHELGRRMLTFSYTMKRDKVLSESDARHVADMIDENPGRKTFPLVLPIGHTDADVTSKVRASLLNDKVTLKRTNKPSPMSAGAVKQITSLKNKRDLLKSRYDDLAGSSHQQKHATKMYRMESQLEVLDTMISHKELDAKLSEWRRLMKHGSELYMVTHDIDRTYAHPDVRSVIKSIPAKSQYKSSAMKSLRAQFEKGALARRINKGFAQGGSSGRYKKCQ